MATILNNSENKILRNSAGKILKQNYNIGKGYKDSSSSYLSMKVRGLTLGLIYTIDMVSGSVPTGANYTVHNINFQDLSALCIGAYYIHGYSSRVLSYYNNVLGTYNTFTAGTARKMLVFKGNTYLASGYSNNYVNATLSNSWTSENTSRYLPYGVISSLYFNKTFADYSFKGMQLYEYRLYSRDLASNEIIYESNNGIFNEPLSMLGLECWYKFDSAELLDFSDALDGSDMRVGIRDFSGNSRHLEFIGLPAGTNEEKITYANTNLFVSW